MTNYELRENRQIVEFQSMQVTKTLPDLKHRPAGPMLVDIVICTYNRSTILKICLDALLPQFTPDLQTIAGLLIVDNNCQDDTIRIVNEIQKTHQFVRLIREERQGLSRARNRGAMASEAEYVCYLDDDG